MNRNIGITYTVTVMALAAAILSGGCAQPGVVVGGSAALAENEDSAAYLDRLSSTPKVSENDALRGMILLLDGKDATKTFAQRVENLKGRNVVSGDWDFDAARTVTRGKLAYMVYQCCSIRGGVILTVTGPSQRYCLRELQYRQLMGEGAAMSPVTGSEMVAVLTRADICRRTGKVPDPVGDTND